MRKILAFTFMLLFTQHFSFTNNPSAFNSPPFADTVSTKPLFVPVIVEALIVAYEAVEASLAVEAVATAAAAGGSVAAGAGTTTVVGAGLSGATVSMGTWATIGTVTAMGTTIGVEAWIINSNTAYAAYTTNSEFAAFIDGISDNLSEAGYQVVRNKNGTAVEILLWEKATGGIYCYSLISHFWEYITPGGERVSPREIPNCIKETIKPMVVSLPDWGNSLSEIRAALKAAKEGTATFGQLNRLELFADPTRTCAGDDECSELRGEVREFFQSLEEEPEHLDSSFLGKIDAEIFITNSSTMSDDELVQEVWNNRALMASPSHMQAVIKNCGRDGTGSIACTMLQELYRDYFLVELPVLRTGQKENRTLRGLMKEYRITVMLFYKLQKKHAGIGKIQDTDKVFALGRNYFISLLERKAIPKREFLQLQMTLAVYGYPIEEWVANGQKTVESEGIEVLGLSDNENTVLKQKNYGDIFSIMKFIRAQKGFKWKEKLSQQIGSDLVDRIVEQLTKLGYGPQLEEE